MTDRLIAFTVTLQRPIREDDAEHIKEAIGMIKGVSKVVPVVQDAATLFAYDRAYRNIYKKVFKALEPSLAAAMEGKDDE